MTEGRNPLDHAMAAAPSGSWEWDISLDKVWIDERFAELYGALGEAPGPARTGDHEGAYHLRRIKGGGAVSPPHPIAVLGRGGRAVAAARC
jgi:hypothetical protein